ncbi:MAG: hypothetical protein ABSD47_20565 [Candidatus Methylomirabilota bacterium]
MRMNHSFFKRRTFLVQPRFQLALAGKALVFLFLYTAIIVYLNLKLMAETIYVLPFDCLTPEVRQRIWVFPTDALLVSLLTALVVVLHVVLASHRVAGPEFHLARTIREMAAGRYLQARTLRKHDRLKGIADSLTFLGQALHEGRQALLEQLTQLGGKAEECSRHVRGGASADIVLARLNGLVSQIGSLKESIPRENGLAEMEQTLPDSGPVPAPPCDPA